MMIWWCVWIGWWISQCRAAYMIISASHPPPPPTPSKSFLIARCHAYLYRVYDQQSYPCVNLYKKNNRRTASQPRACSRQVIMSIGIWGDKNSLKHTSQYNIFYTENRYRYHQIKWRSEVNWYFGKIEWDFHENGSWKVAWRLKN